VEAHTEKTLSSLSVTARIITGTVGIGYTDFYR
jgi:hypothetical protein